MHNRADVNSSVLLVCVCYAGGECACRPGYAGKLCEGREEIRAEPAWYTQYLGLSWYWMVTIVGGGIGVCCLVGGGFVHAIEVVRAFKRDEQMNESESTRLLSVVPLRLCSVSDRT